jgi:hypothetical protein
VQRLRELDQQRDRDQQAYEDLDFGNLRGSSPDADRAPGEPFKARPAAHVSGGRA